MNSPFDIAIVGAGAAGIAAAVSAARRGCRTLLLDQRESAGGTGGFSGLTTLCGLYDDTGQMLNDGFAREFAEAIGEGAPVQTGKVWVLRYRPERFREVAAGYLQSTEHTHVPASPAANSLALRGTSGERGSHRENGPPLPDPLLPPREERETIGVIRVRGRVADIRTPELRTAWNSPVHSVAIQAGEISRLNGISVRAVIDCSGTAEVARAVGAECLSTNEQTQAAAVVFPLHDIARELDSVVAATQVLLPLARAGLPPVSFQPHPEPHSVTVKLTGSPEHAPKVIEFLRQNVAGFENCRTSCTEFRPSHRAGRMIIGEYVLTGEDVLGARKFPDAVARCAWPVEQWNAAGVSRVRYLPSGEHYEIPARCLRAAGISNLFMAGKTISADVDAIASARVMGCCLATGTAAGNLAAAFVTSAQQQQQQ